MARKPRDHKAEYAARKRKAQALGYSSVRKYRKTRKELELSPREPTPSRDIARIRRESKEWSDKHSLRRISKYKPEMPDDGVIGYHRAFVLHPYDDDTPRKRRRMKEYYTKWLGFTESEWDHNPSTIPLRTR